MSQLELRRRLGNVLTLFGLAFVVGPGCADAESLRGLRIYLKMEPPPASAPEPEPHFAAKTTPTPASTQARQIPLPHPSPSATPQALGRSCADSETLCLGLRYVVLREPARRQVSVPQEEALRNLEEINRVWSQCQVAFQIDEYLTVNPDEYPRLRANPADAEELDLLRRSFANDQSLLVVTTGDWDRRGSLGNTWANAWTQMPGGRTHGVVLEAAVGTYPNIIAHELGHYLGLDHEESIENLMSPIVGQDSVGLGRRQCRDAAVIAREYWEPMLRTVTTQE